MWRQIQVRFTRQKARLSVVRKMIELGVGVEDSRLRVGSLPVSDTAVAEAAGVDRRVVRNTVNQIARDKDLYQIFSKIRPVGASLVEVADELGYSVLIVSADPHRPGVISGVSSILAEHGVVIRQALADDPDFVPDPKLTFVVDGKLPSEAIAKIKSLPVVESLTLK